MFSNNNATTTQLIVNDYFTWRLKNKSSSTTTNRLFILVRRIGSESERMFSQQPVIDFRCIPSFRLNKFKNMHYVFANVLFNNRQITWSRIITFISFSALIAEHLIRERKQDNMDLIIASVVEWTTDFIDINLHTWLESQNYWAGFLKIIDKTAEQRNYISRYVSIIEIIGIVTLGILYMRQ
ncbi:unnamed protein product [Rotaria sp. Silwood1]|nr:unnamed protein product [Rotaria sp. Silwood1]